MKPILSYYKLKRASQLLEIEVDDIIHFWLMDKLDLQVNLDGINCRLARYLPNDKNFLSAIRVIGDDLYNNRDVIDNLRWFTFKGDEDDKGGIGKDDNLRLIYYRGLAYGLWRVSPTIVTRFINDELILSDSEGIHNIEGKTGIAFVSGHCSNNLKINDKLFFDSPLKVSVNDLVIDKNNFDSLGNILNGKDFSNNERDSGNFASMDLNEEKKERLSSPQKIAIKVMARKLYPNIINSPENLANALTADAEKQGEKGAKFDGSTVGRWLKD